MGTPLITARADRGARSNGPFEDQSVGPESLPDESRALRPGHSISIGDRQSAHREAASFSAFVSARPTRPGVRSRSATALRIQDSADDASEVCGSVIHRIRTQRLGMEFPVWSGHPRAWDVARSDPTILATGSSLIRSFPLLFDCSMSPSSVGHPSSFPAGTA